MQSRLRDRDKRKIYMLVDLKERVHLNPYTNDCYNLLLCLGVSPECVDVDLANRKLRNKCQDKYAFMDEDAIQVSM